MVKNKQTLLLIAIIVLSFGVICLAFMHSRSNNSTSDVPQTGTDSFGINHANSGEADDILSEDLTNRENDAVIIFTASEIELRGTNLVKVIALKENTSTWLNRPAYVFLAEKTDGAVDGSAESKSDDESVDEGNGNTGQAVYELFATAIENNKSFVADGENYMASCQCVPIGNFIIVVGNERYFEAVNIFENVLENGEEKINHIEDLVKYMSFTAPVPNSSQ